MADMMHSFSAIACVDENWGIGYKNNLILSLEADMINFREMTTHHTILMGHNTYLSMNRKPLPNRFNVMLSRQARIADGVMVCHSVDEVMHKVNPYDTYIIGGEAIYNAFLQYCRYFYITKVATKREADSFFPNLDAMGSRFKQIDCGIWYTGVDRLTGEVVPYCMTTYIQQSR